MFLSQNKQHCSTFYFFKEGLLSHKLKIKNSSTFL